MTGSDKLTIFVYGSLKKGFYNHPLLDVEGVEFLDTVEIPGVVLYDLGYYPAVVLTHGPTLVEAEAYRVPQRVFDFLNRMETGAGYDFSIYRANSLMAPQGYIWHWPDDLEGQRPKVDPDPDGVARWREK